MRLIDAEKITEKEICFFLGKENSSCADDVMDLLNAQPTARDNGETCEWQSPAIMDENYKFKVQCNHNPLKRGTVPANFSYRDFVYCPFCGRKIDWLFGNVR